jgi:hypothetical protein
VWRHYLCSVLHALFLYINLVTCQRLIGRSFISRLPHACLPPLPSCPPLTSRLNLSGSTYHQRSRRCHYRLAFPPHRHPSLVSHCPLERFYSYRHHLSPINSISNLDLEYITTIDTNPPSDVDHLTSLTTPPLLLLYSTPNPSSQFEMASCSKSESTM